MNIKKIITIIFITALVVPSAYFAYGYLYNGQNSGPTDELTVADANFQSNALYFIALQKGYFKDENLVVNRKKFTLGKDALSDVVAGNSDLALVPDTAFLVQFKNGEDIKIIATVQKSQKSTGIIGWRKLGVNYITDLPGKKVGIVKGTNSEFLFLSLLANNNIPKDKITIYYGGLNELDELFRLKKLDAVSIGNPNLFQIQEDVGESEISQFYSNGNIDATVITGETGIINDKQREIQKFLRAMKRAETFAENPDNREEAISIVTKVMDTDPTSTVESLWDNYHLTLDLDNLLLEILGAHSEALSSLEGLPNHPEDLKNAVFPDYLTQVAPDDVTIFK